MSEEDLINDLENAKYTINELIKANGNLTNILTELEEWIKNEYSFNEDGMKIIDKSKLEDTIQELKEKYK